MLIPPSQPHLLLPLPSSPPYTPTSIGHQELLVIPQTQQVFSCPYCSHYSHWQTASPHLDPPYEILIQRTAQCPLFCKTFLDFSNHPSSPAWECLLQAVHIKLHISWFVSCVKISSPQVCQPFLKGNLTSWIFE